MPSFFTTPASAKKRKRAESSLPSGSAAKKAAITPSVGGKKKKRAEGEEISSDEDEERRKVADESEEEDDEFADETAGDKRRRLALQYLENTKAEIEESGFDAEDIDRDLLAERLKESVAEDKGRIYRRLADTHSFSNASHTHFRADTKSTTGIAVCYPYIYTTSKDRHLIKWRIPDPSSGATKPRQALHTRCATKKSNKDYQGGHTDEILTIAASQDGKFVATGGKDNRVIVWDPSTLKPLQIFKQHRSPVMGLVFRRNTNQMYSCSADRTVKSWNLDELAYVETLFGHQDEVVGITALAGERCVTVGARDRTARLWKIVDETQLVFRGEGSKKRKTAASGQEEQFAEGSIDCVAMIDEEHFVTGSDNGSISFWTTNKKKPIFTVPIAHGKPPPLPATSYTAESSISPSTFPPPPPQPRAITALAAIPYSDTFLSGSYDGYVRVWKVSGDKKRIEAVGELGANEEDSSSPSPSPSNALTTIISTDLPNPHTNRSPPTRGVINSISVFETAPEKKRKDTPTDLPSSSNPIPNPTIAGIGGDIYVAVALGKEMRLGRWLTVPGRNGAVLFKVGKRGKEREKTGSASGGAAGVPVVDMSMEVTEEEH